MRICALTQSHTVTRARARTHTHTYTQVSSFDTVGNAYFALTIHAIPAGWRKVAVVTSAFHMPRTRALFEDLWSRAARDIWKDPDWCVVALTVQGTTAYTIA